jgi:hypothetical protein
MASLLENLQKACHEDNLAICLKNSLFFEVSAIEVLAARE